MPASLTITTQGKILVSEGEKVFFDQIIAREESLPSSVSLNLAKLLVISSKKCPRCLIKKPGEEIKATQIIAKSKSFLGLKRKAIKAPCDGFLEKVSAETGEVIITLPRTKKEIKSPVDGKIKKINDREIIISFTGQLLELEETVGHLSQGEIAIVNNQENNLSLLTKDCRGKIICGESFRRDTLEKALALGVKAIIGVNFYRTSLTDFKGKTLTLGRKEEKLIFNLGRINQENFLILKSRQGKKGIFDPVTKKLIILTD